MTIPAISSGQAAEPVVELSFWQRPFVQNVLPFLSSLTFHAAVVVIGVVSYAVYQGLPHRQVPLENETTIPEGSMVDSTSLPEGLKAEFRGNGNGPRIWTLQNVDKSAGEEAIGGWAKTRGVGDSLIEGGGSREQAGAYLIGVGNNPFQGGKGNGSGPGSGDGSGSGGQIAPFGPNPRNGGSSGVERSIFPPNRVAKRIAYVCDASGSMQSKFDDLRAELVRSIDGLRPIQSFNVIFFSEGKPQTADSKALIFALPDQKRRVEDFISNAVARGSTDPIPGLELAFKQQPDLIYLLTDGDFPDNAAVLKFIREHNVGAHKAKINTIAFMDHGAAYEKVLQDIARENDGVFRYVSNEELSR